MLKKFYSLSIRVHLVLLIVLLAIPSISLIVYSGLDERREAIAGARAECLKFVNDVAGQHQAIVAGTEQLAAALSLLPPLQSRNPEATTAIFSELLRKNPQYASISVTDTSGLVWASATPFEGKVSLADRRYFQEAVRTGLFSSGEYLVGRMVKKPVMSFGYPVKNGANKLTAVIVVVLELGYAQNMFEKISLPQGASFSLLDHRGIILIRNLKDNFSEKLVGRRDIREENFTRMQEEADEGTFESMGNDGNVRLVAYKRISLAHETKPYIYIRSSIPLSSATSKARVAMRWNLSAFVSFFLVGLLLASLIGKHVIVNPVVKLKEAAGQLAAGTDTVNVSHRVKGGELGELARAFDGMAEALIQREKAKNVIETALREGEQQIREQMVRLQAVLDAAPAMIWMAFDPECREISGNRTAYQLSRVPEGMDMSKTGQTPDRLAHYRIFKDGVELAPNEMPLQRVAASGQPLTNYALEFLFDDNTERSLLGNVVPVLDAEGKPTGAVAAFLDITERKKAEEALRESERRERERAAELEVLLEAVPTPIIIVHDADSLHMTGNRATDELLRNPSGAEVSLSAPAEVKPRHFRAFKDGRELKTDELPAQRAARGEHVSDFEFSLVFNDGMTRHVVGYGTPLLEEDGRPRGAVHVLVDITERKKAEEALRHRTLELQHLTENLEERVRERTADLATLSSRLVSSQEDERRRVSYDLHDHVWQALVAIRFEIERLFSDDYGADREALQGKAKKVMAAILDTVGKIRSMQGDLWPYVLDDIGILATIDWYCREFEKSHPGLTITREVGLGEDEIPPSVKIVVYRILQEALSNVAKHSRANHVRLRLRKEDGRMEFIVVDDGIGFDVAEMIASRFPLEGLGLLSVKARTELSGGHFGVESAAGMGTTIRASWPFQGTGMGTDA